MVKRRGFSIQHALPRSFAVPCALERPTADNVENLCPPPMLRSCLLYTQPLVDCVCTPRLPTMPSGSTRGSLHDNLFVFFLGGVIHAQNESRRNERSLLREGTPGNGGTLGLFLDMFEITPQINRQGTFFVDAEGRQLAHVRSAGRGGGNKWGERAIIFEWLEHF